ncbi:MAG: hypothetical protein N3C12_12680 [Candidatus Binatia bacterium]|nr:hypothetical protein [Candidatus Binatia bacterium]
MAKPRPPIAVSLARAAIRDGPEQLLGAPDHFATSTAERLRLAAAPAQFNSACRDSARNSCPERQPLALARNTAVFLFAKRRYHAIAMEEAVLDRRLIWGLVASLLVHMMLLTSLRSSWFSIVPPQALLPIEVDLAPPPPPPPAPKANELPLEPAPNAEPAQPQLVLPERQIVNPPDAGEEATPRNTRLLSDRDNRVAEETVRRADRYQEKPAKQAAATERRQKESAGAAAGSNRASEHKAMKNPAPAGEQIAALPKLDQLLPNIGDVSLPAAAQPTPAEGGTSEAGPKRRLLLDSGGPTFSVQPGTADFLPGIREGNITLLNTKAERFAPFVRRVAARVFQHLDIRLRQTARAGNASAGREYAIVEAIMDRQGQLVRARVVERQSTSTFGADRVLLSVTTPDTFFDANPPPGAEASDGYIHFLLLIDLDIVTVPDPRSGRIAVGYRGIAGVGLDALADRR